MPFTDVGGSGGSLASGGTAAFAGSRGAALKGMAQSMGTAIEANYRNKFESFKTKNEAIWDTMRPKNYTGGGNAPSMGANKDYGQIGNQIGESLAGLFGRKGSSGSSGSSGFSAPDYSGFLKGSSSGYGSGKGFGEAGAGVGGGIGDLGSGVLGAISKFKFF